KLKARTGEVIPVLKEELDKEIKKPEPDQFFLLDAARFLQLNDRDSRTLGLSALTSIDPPQHVIRANADELSKAPFAFADGNQANEQVFPIFDRLFLASDLTVFIAEHSLTLRGSQLCAFVYGPFGASAERHLAARLEQSPEQLERVVGMLNWMGSPTSLDMVQRVLDRKPSQQVF